MDPGKWGFSRQVPVWKSPIGCLEMGINGDRTNNNYMRFGWFWLHWNGSCPKLQMMFHEEMMMNHRIWVYHCFFPCFFTNPTCYSLYFKWVLSRLLLTPLLDHHVTQRGVFPRIPHPNIKDRILKIFPKSASLGVGKKKNSQNSLTSSELNQHFLNIKNRSDWMVEKSKTMVESPWLSHSCVMKMGHAPCLNSLPYQGVHCYMGHVY
jgi:hypothetical protein